jgi:hypothetical protein
MSGTQGDGRDRFLRAIAERIAPERIEEIHIFPAIRQGGREMGVAVIAVRLESPEVADGPAEDNREPEPVEIEPVEAEQVEAEPVEPDPVEPAVSTPPQRLTIFRASYRLTLKGAERGKWEMGVVEEADAPASTVEEVVRGVHERAAVADDGPERLTGDALRALIAGAGAPWTAPR